MAHDSHNIIAAESSDKYLTEAVNLIIKEKGGIALVDGENAYTLPLPIAGLMSNLDCRSISKKYSIMKQCCQVMGSDLYDPFMTLSFLDLLVIPSIKLSDKGLFDADNFKFIFLSNQ